MPVVDAFPTRLRTDLEAAYEEDLDDVFDVASVRAALEGRLRSLETELHQVSQRLVMHLSCFFSSLTLLPIYLGMRVWDQDCRGQGVGLCSVPIVLP